MNDYFGRIIERGNLIVIACGGYHDIGVFLEATPLSVRYYALSEWRIEHHQSYLNGSRTTAPHVSYINSVRAGRILIISRETLPLREQGYYDTALRCIEMIECRKSLKRLKHD